MVFVGDSVTAGYGNEGPDAKCHWSAARENNHATYGAFAARELNAEYVAAAWSGRGVTRNYDAREVSLLSELRERVIPTEADSPKVEHARADVVVVNLGTNDFALGIPEEASFADAYDALLVSLRAQYPEALLVLQVGPMLSDHHPHPGARTRLREWVEQARTRRRAAGDTRCEMIELWTARHEGAGCDSHPNVVTHARFGRELAALVRRRLAW
jgi:lysophospholipase L1-like esterase